MKKLSFMLLATAAVLPSHVLAEIGSVAAVNRDMDGTPPAAETRALNLGNRVVTDELIRTSPLGSGQLMFLDQTTLTVAPDSNIVLDEYVYDPNTQSGDMALTITRGALRLIGGRITKKTDAIVTTPTATVGIRGGLVLIEVDADGTTRVILLAGEYAKVTDLSNGPDGGQVIYLSRPNAWAEITGEGAEFAGLIPAEVLERLYKRFEGQGDGGTATAAIALADASIEKIARLNSQEEGGERRQPVSTSGEDSHDDQADGDQEDDDETIEQRRENGPTGQVAQGPTDNTPPIDPPDPPEPPLVDVPTGGAFFAPSTGAVGFTEVFQGSLIGANNGVFFVEAIVPTEPDDLAPGFGPNETTFAAVRGDTQGFFELSLGVGDFEFDPITEVGLGASDIIPSINNVETVDYIGFSDLDQNFHVFQFIVNDNLGGGIPVGPAEEIGQFFFGDPSLNQAVVPSLAAIDARLSANVQGAYKIEPNLNADGGPNLPGENLRIISNGGERLASLPDTFEPSLVPGGFRNGLINSGLDLNIGSEPVTGGDVININNQAGTGSGSSAVFIDFDQLEANGGRVLSGEAVVNGEGETRLAVFAQPLNPNAKSLSFGGSALSTERLFNDEVGFFLRTGEQNFGTFEDNDGNTVFGFGDEYIIASSVFREGGDPASPYQFDPGFTQNFGSEQEREIEFSQNLLSKNDDTNLNGIISEPLPLSNLGFADRETSPTLTSFFSGIMACSDRQCGRDVNPDPQIVELSGQYAVRTKVFNGGTSSIEFDSSVSGGDSNGLIARIEVAPEQQTRLPGTNGEEEAQFEFNIGDQAITAGAYADDEVFGIAEGGNVVIREVGTRDAFAIVASTGLVGGAGILPEPGDELAEFLRWGFWSAGFSEGSTREDLTHMGLFVGGQLPDLSQLPSDIEVGYSGQSFGERVGTPGATPSYVTGTFDLNYNFGTRRGEMGIDIGGIDINGASTFGSSSDPRVYGAFGFDQQTGSSLQADGAFYATRDFSVGATAGSFQIQSDTGAAITGVYGGTAVPE